ncbi:hypothetical protein LCGC14_0632250 [marine sediment metagenome]|uniref:Uncharacterized protein n=1 Tax=marine sediment metagenome TaxID=412755 RepID=A0A0F9R1L1_9ZZZZ
MSITQKHTLQFKKNNCDQCEKADKADIRRGRPACDIFKKTGQWPPVVRGHCSERKDRRGRHAAPETTHGK